VKISEKKGRVSHLFFETNLGKKIDLKKQTKKTFLNKPKKKQKGKEKKYFCKAILPVLTASP